MFHYSLVKRLLRRPSLKDIKHIAWNARVIDTSNKSGRVKNLLEKYQSNIVLLQEIELLEESH